MRHFLVVVDMQKDFVDGALGSKEAQAIIPAAVEKIRGFDGELFVTFDTHFEDYLETAEGKKYTFGSMALPRLMAEFADGEDFTIELIGLCTDICVVSNALILKAFFPEAPISVDSACCAGVTPALHEAALETMKSCQIDVI